MQINIDGQTRELGKLFEQGGFELYLVGGRVRNEILNLPLGDFDICGAATPLQVEKILENSGLKCELLNCGFGTVLLRGIVNCEPYLAEYTTFRQDSYGMAGAHKPEAVVFTSDINVDAVRRDFTVNAIYANVKTGNIVDPTGGLVDIKNKMLKATGKDPDVIMQDDGLRTLRLVRFAAELGFKIDKNTLNSAKKHASGLADISPERIRQELEKILMADVKYGVKSAHFRGLELTTQLGLMQYIFPELLCGQGVVQRSDYHAYDVYNHALHACDCSEAELELRLSALLHDVGKPYVFSQSGSMHSHDVRGEILAREMLNRLTFAGKIVDKVCKLVRYHMFDLTGRARQSTVRLSLARLGKETARQFILLREADVHGSGLILGKVTTAERFKAILQDMIDNNTPFSENEINVTGDEIMQTLNLKPGKIVGEIKRALWLHCVNRPSDNNKIRLLRLAAKYERSTNCT